MRVERDDARLEAAVEFCGDYVLKTDYSLVTTRLPLEDGRVIEIRKPSLPDAEQALVYSRLGRRLEAGLPGLEIHHKVRPE